MKLSQRRTPLLMGWLKFLEELGIEYQTDLKDSKLLSGKKYAPAIYLPQSNTYIEVMDGTPGANYTNIHMFIVNKNVQVVTAKNDFRFEACSTVKAGPNKALRINILTFPPKGVAMLCKCKSCGGLFFTASEGTRECRCCGSEDVDGDNIVVLATGESLTDITSDAPSDDDVVNNAVRAGRKAYMEELRELYRDISKTMPQCDEGENMNPDGYCTPPTEG